MSPEKKSRVAEFVKDYKGALHKLAVPMLIGFGVTTLYNVVDTIFVGGLGYEAIAALTFAFPVFFFLFAIAMGLGVGFTATIA
ncbi:TPA: MATE family efflux transporter, partial [Candidatus Micrarchaeota archaeon]|nr:MATE family efflux transporter [Candidatus Micrarchaeota archaeon]